MARSMTFIRVTIYNSEQSAFFQFMRWIHFYRWHFKHRLLPASNISENIPYVVLAGLICLWVINTENDTLLNMTIGAVSLKYLI